jgi:GTP cyclohydrolase I
MPVDFDAAEQAIAEFLRALGYDLDAHPELRETPARVTRAYADELLRGNGIDVAELVRTGSEPFPSNASGGLVAVRDIETATVCPHHLTPALGRATVAYLPGTRLLGVGTVARLVDACARRLSMQESVGQQVVDALMRHAGARGAYCRLVLVHGCLSARGACQTRASVATAASAGELTGSAAAPHLRLLVDDRTEG